MISSNCVMSNCGTVNLKKNEYEWEICDFLNYKTVGQHITSPIFLHRTNNEDTKWQLKLYPHGEDKENEDYLSVYLTSMDNSSIKATSSFFVKDNTYRTASSPDKFNSTRRTWGHPQFIKRDKIIDLVQMSNNNLTLCCEISNVTVLNSSARAQISDPKKEIARDFGHLLYNSDFSDVTLTLGTKEFQLHKAILAVRSSVFAAMFKSEMKEKETNEVKIEEIEPHVFEEFLKFLYTGDVEITEKTAKDLLMTADRYAVEGLKNLSITKLCQMINIENVIDTLMIADFYKIIELKDFAIDFIISATKEGIDISELKLLEKIPHILTELFQKSVSRKN